MAVASQTALPGDALYPLKRGIESAHAQLTFDRAARGRVLLDNASTRLDEVAELSRTGASADAGRPDPRRLHPAGDRRLRPADRATTRRPATSRRSPPSAPSPRRAWRGCACSRAPSRPAPSTSCCTRPRRSTRCSRSRRTPARPAPGPSVTAGAQRAHPGRRRPPRDSWLVAAAVGGRVAPTTRARPPAAWSCPRSAATSRRPASPTPRRRPPTWRSRPRTTCSTPLQHLTDGLTDNQQTDLGSTVTDTAGNLLDAVGDVGNTAGRHGRRHPRQRRQRAADGPADASLIGPSSVSARRTRAA